jgi:hypothetical protein
MTSRQVEEMMLTRCVVVASQAGACASDVREAHVFRLAD